MRQQDKILSRQKTRLNPIKFHSSSCGGGGRGQGNKTTEYDSITNRILCGYARAVATWHEQMLWILALALLCDFSCAVSPSITSPPTLGYRTNARDRRWRRQAVEYSVIKTCWEGRYSTHTHISVIWFWRREGGGGEGQDTVISPVPSTRNLMNYITVFTWLWERQTSFT